MLPYGEEGNFQSIQPIVNKLQNIVFSCQIWLGFEEEISLGTSAEPWLRRDMRLS